jgi:hypothetical protein
MWWHASRRKESHYTITHKTNYKLKGLQFEKVIHRKICISKDYILIHFDSTTTTIYYNIIMGCCNFCYIKLLCFFSFRTRSTNLRTLLPGSSRMFHSIKKYFLYFILLCLVVYYMILPFWQSLIWCDLISYILAYIVILYLIYILIMPIVFLCFQFQNSRFQNIMGISCIFIISYIMVFIFMMTLPIITFNNDVIIQQGDKVYQCVVTYESALQAYPVVLDLNSPVIEDYRDHGHSCDLLSYGPVCPYGQTPKASPNYLKYHNGSRFLDAFVCKQNDPEGVNLCHRYISVSSDWKFLWSLICNCTLDNGEDTGVTAAISCLQMRCIWITVLESDVITHHEGNFTRH